MLQRVIAELELYVGAGIPAGEALRIATWNGAQAVGALGLGSGLSSRR